MALIATFGNIIAFLYNFLSFRSRAISAYSIFTCNLNFSDMLMGLYLYIIAFINLVYTGTYGLEDYSWRHSTLCTVAGIIATTSSESSALFVSLITLDRILAIRNPLSWRRLTKVGASLLSILSWVISLSLAVFPILPMDLSSFYDFYAQTSICIYLPLSVHRKSGWQYSVAVFVGFNFFLFLGILVGQFMILFEVIKSGRKVQSSGTLQRDIALAKSVCAVVVTDLFCWIPIGIIGMLTFSGIDVSPEVYAWIIVLVLPVNSALNPILYTLSAFLRERIRKTKKNCILPCQTNADSADPELTTTAIKED
ncbi:G-protein coupled receptor GRL101-like [Saccostrea echinata]|uniref:G-protein coupled receptor GRL101-like n=1 Tax=Saccostrea echinata TaxID=191078 RepID=UPI002A80A3FA|nr:G-protein coupled receptor GRL101-like [Saccostrea echinata]